MVEISNGEELKPGGGIRFNSVYELEGRGEFSAEPAWYLIYRICRMEKCIKPKLTTNLLLCNIGSCHLDHSAPSLLDKAIGGLTTGIGGDDTAFISAIPAESLPTDKLLVKVGVERLRDGAGIRAELFESGNDVGGSNGRHAVHPAVTGSDIDNNESIAVVSEGDAIAKHNIHVYFVKVAAVFAVGFAGGRIGDSRKGS